MKRLGFYWAYATRSLVRGGQRTLLALFCVAVGVLAIVSLQLVGNMVNNGLTSNVRDSNGGDISVSASLVPLRDDQLNPLDQLKSNGTIADYTGVRHLRASTPVDGANTAYMVTAVDPARFPLSGTPVFTQGSGPLSSALAGTGVVLTDKLADKLKLKAGDGLTLQLASTTGNPTPVAATVNGVVKAAGVYNDALALVSQATANAALKGTKDPVQYAAVYVNVANHDDALAKTAKQQIAQLYPTTTITTTQEALDQNKASVQQIRYFLQVVGLLALLIGGIGIVNTMQVLLRRRQVEIAMLKTAGYRRSDLYAMFGLEAGLLGLLGGAVGAAAGVGVAFLVKQLVERAFLTVLPSAIDPLTVASGVAIGFATALIFGLMPIVQASEVRPLAVLRGLSEGAGTQSILLSIVLSIILVVLFFGLALVILGNVIVAGFSVVGAGVFLLVLSAAFALIVFLIGKFPVPERIGPVLLVVGVVEIVVALAISVVLPAFGILLLVVAVAGLLAWLLPRNAKANIKLSLRNISRQRARAVTTLVALFVGIFAIGLILVLGQNIKDTINKAFGSSAQYNAYVIAPPKDVSAVEGVVSGLDGKTRERKSLLVQNAPVAVNGTPINAVLANVPDQSSISEVGKDGLIYFLSGVQGYDLSAGDFPNGTISKGRALTAADVGTNNILAPYPLTLAPLKLKPGDTLTLASADNKGTQTLTIVGFYQSGAVELSFPLSVDVSLAKKLGAGQEYTLFGLNLNPSKADAQLKQVQQVSPSAQTFSLAELTKQINDLLNNLILMLTAVASLAMFAGIIIIANAVALAMLERRREIGILKSVGYTSRTVLGGVLLENGLIGFTGAFLAMALVTLATTILDKLLFKSGFGVSVPIVLLIVGATAAVCMAVAASVAWTATRVRPLEVLRYE